MTIVAGADNLSKYNLTPVVNRLFCKTCGTHVMASYNQPEKVGMYVSSANIFPKMPFKPTCHASCESCGDPALLAAIHDGLPKFKDLPKEMGGSGDMWRRQE